MWFTIPDAKLYNKYKEKANQNCKSDFFSTDKIMSLAKKANFIDEAKEQLLSFCKVVEKDEDLKRYIHLIYYIAYYTDAKFVSYEYHAELPKSVEVEQKYAGMTELIIGLLATERFYNYVDEKGLNEYIERESYNQKIKKFVEENKVKNGTYGLVDWGYFLYLYATGQILHIGRLVFQKCYFHDYMEVYRKGDEYIKIATPNYRYTKDGYMTWDTENSHNAVYEKVGNILKCQTYDKGGLLVDKVIELNLDEYELFLDKNTRVLNLHIPDGNLSGPLLPELVDKAFELAKIVTKKEGVWKPKTFTCTSWMMSLGVKGVIKPTSNIYNFMDRFDCIEVTENTYSLYGHIFNVAKCPVNELVPQNDFQARILDMVKSGNPLRSGHGYIKGEIVL